MKRHGIWTVVLTILMTVALPVWAEETDEATVEPLWEGSVGLSYLSTSGNSDTTSFGLDFTAKRRPNPWGYEFFGLFSRAEESGTLTAERYFGGARGLRSLGDRWNLFAGLTGEKDPFAGFDLRAVLSAGATYKAIDNDSIKLSLDGGLTYTDENVIDTYTDEGVLVPGADTSYMGAVLGLDFAWHISKNAVLKQLLAYYPNFDESPDWRVESVTALEASLTDLFGVRFPGHPDLRRIMMSDDWEGHPYRRDYPLAGRAAKCT